MFSVPVTLAHKLYLLNIKRLMSRIIKEIHAAAEMPLKKVLAILTVILFSSNLNCDGKLSVPISFIDIVKLESQDIGCEQ